MFYEIGITPSQSKIIDGVCSNTEIYIIRSKATEIKLTPTPDTLLLMSYLFIKKLCLPKNLFRQPELSLLVSSSEPTEFELA